jgi:hypothetical protein
MSDDAGTMLRKGRIECGGIENVTLHKRAPAHELCVPLGKAVECVLQSNSLAFCASPICQILRSIA